MMNKQMKLYIKGIYLIVIISLIMFIISGCWDSHEINELGIVGAVGIDLDENGNTKITIELKQNKQAKSGEEQQASVDYIQAEGKNLSQAFSNSSFIAGKKLFWTHIKLIILGEKYAQKEGLGQLLDFFQRWGQIITNGYIIVSKDTPASDIMKISNDIVDVPSDYFEALISVCEKDSSKSVSTDVPRFLQCYYNEGIEPRLCLMQNQEEESIISQNKEERQNISVEGAAVFLEEKLVGFLDGNETLGLNIITNKMQNSIISCKTPEENEITSVQLESAKSKNDIQIEEKDIIINVKTKVGCSILEQTGSVDLLDNTVIKLIQESLSDKIKNQMLSLIKRVQNEFKADIFGFGQELQRNNLSAWKELKNSWNEVFSQADVNVEVETEITSTGYTDIPAGQKEANK